MRIYMFALLIFLMAATRAPGADLPTVTIEHLYYLQARAERVRRFKPDEMVEYCLAQKMGGAAFESAYSQLFTVRTELVKLVDIGETPDTDPTVVMLRKNSEVYTKLLREEAAKMQNGMIHEGQVATDALGAIAKAQSGR